MAKYALFATAGLAAAVNADNGIGFGNQDGGWAATLNADNSALRMALIGRDHKSHGGPHWYSVKYRGLYEVDSTGAMACSLTANGTDHYLRLDSMEKGTIQLVSI